MHELSVFFALFQGLSIANLEHFWGVSGAKRKMENRERLKFVGLFFVWPLYLYHYIR